MTKSKKQEKLEEKVDEYISQLREDIDNQIEYFGEDLTELIKSIK